MDKDYLKLLIESGLSIRKISAQTKISYTTIRYWFKKYDLKTKYLEPKVYGKYRLCPRCETKCKTEDFYNKNGILYASIYCKQCATKQSMTRMKNFKIKCVEYKGGKCVVCGYKKYIGALEFHHLDRTQKSFNISNLRSYTFDQTVIDELDKCALVCANCHREVEAEIVVIPV